MPWLSEEISDWEELSPEVQEKYRDAVRALGMEFPDAEEEDYFE